MTRLLQVGVAVNTLNKFGATPLHKAVAEGRAEAVKHLVIGGADVNRLDSFGETPLHQAARQGETECVTILLRHGANVAAETLDGLLPIHIACTKVRARLLSMRRSNQRCELTCPCVCVQCRDTIRA